MSLAQILELAPDASSQKAGKDLARASKWLVCAKADSILWGEIKGSGAQPYRIVVDIATSSSKCTCPSRKFPCKHGLGLMILSVQSPNDLAALDMPAWVETWLQHRVAKSAPKTAAPKDEKAAAKRQDARLQKIDQGVLELDVWLEDLWRRGRASLQQEPFAFWDRMVSRLHDAQAPTLAYQVRAFSTSVHDISDERWVRQLSTLSLLTRAWSKRDQLPEIAQQDLRLHVGMPVAPHTPAQHPWKVLAHEIKELDDKIKQRTVWLAHDTEIISVVDFSVPAKAFPAFPSPGQVFQGVCSPYPGASRRGVMEQIEPCKEPVLLLGQSIATFLDTSSAHLAEFPWQGAWPGMLKGVQMAKDARQQFALMDATGGLPLDGSWEMMAMMEGRPADIFGLWRGDVFEPLSVFQGVQMFIKSGSMWQKVGS